MLPSLSTIFFIVAFTQIVDAPCSWRAESSTLRDECSRAHCRPGSSFLFDSGLIGAQPAEAQYCRLAESGRFACCAIVEMSSVAYCGRHGLSPATDARKQEAWTYRRFGVGGSSGNCGAVVGPRSRTRSDLRRVRPSAVGRSSGRTPGNDQRGGPPAFALTRTQSRLPTGRRPAALRRRIPVVDQQAVSIYHE